MPAGDEYVELAGEVALVRAVVFAGLAMFALAALAGDRFARNGGGLSFNESTPHAVDPDPAGTVQHHDGES